MPQMLKMSDKHTPKPETMLKQWYGNQKESSKEILVFSRIVIRKYSGHNVLSKLKTKTGVVPLLQDKKDETSTKCDDSEKANILPKQFVSVFTKKPNAKEFPLSKKRLK